MKWYLLFLFLFVPFVSAQSVPVLIFNANANSSGYWDDLDGPTDITGSEFWYNQSTSVANPFDQNLNTTENVQFENITLGDSLIFDSNTYMKLSSNKITFQSDEVKFAGDFYPSTTDVFDLGFASDRWEMIHGVELHVDRIGNLTSMIGNLTIGNLYGGSPINVHSDLNGTYANATFNQYCNSTTCSPNVGGGAGAGGIPATNVAFLNNSQVFTGGNNFSGIVRTTDTIYFPAGGYASVDEFSVNTTEFFVHILSNCSDDNEKIEADAFGTLVCGVNPSTDDNSSWNQTYANTLYADIKWGYNMSDGTYNSTYHLYAYNMSDHSYNSTYHSWAYNQSEGAYTTWNDFWNSTYNATYALYAYNQSDGVGTGNSSWNQTYANTLYADIKWGYNMSDHSYNSTYHKWAYNMSDGAGGIPATNVAFTNNSNTFTEAQTVITLYSGSGMVNTGDTNTYYNFLGTDALKMAAGGNSFFILEQLDAGQDTAQFNPSTLDIDFLMDGNNLVDLFKLDAGDDTVKIKALKLVNTVSCDADNEKLETDANGNITCGVNPSSSGNSSWNQTYANTLYADIQWDYNQSLGAYATWNDFWNSTYNSTYDKWAYNQSDHSYNSTYHTYAYNQSDGNLSSGGDVSGNLSVINNANISVAGMSIYNNGTCTVLLKGGNKIFLC